VRLASLGRALARLEAHISRIGTLRASMRLALF